MQHRFYLFIALALTAWGGCKDGGGDGGSGAHTQGPGSGGAGTGGAAAIPASTEPLANAAVQGMAAIAALAGPLVGGGDQLHGQQDTADDTTARGLVENAIAGNSIVTDGNCVTFDWTGLSVTVTFTGCTLEATGLSLDGALTLGVMIKPTTFSMSFDGLMVGGTGIDGSIALSFTGADPPTRSVDADLTFTSGTSSTHLTLSDVTTNATPTSVTVSGTGAIESDALNATLGVEELTWLFPNRCPSSGTLDVDEDGPTPPATVTFLPTTPVDGGVTVQVGAWPPQSMTLVFCAE